MLVGLLSLCIEIFRGEDKPFLNIATVNFGMVWLGLLLGSLISVRLIPEHGFIITMAMFVSVWICDTAAFWFGMKFGKRKILPKVSPNKTWEGLLGAVITIMLISGFLAPFLTPLDFKTSLIAGLLISLAGFIGDIVISSVKRDLEIKDTGNLIPGHGGLLDRLDSLTYTAPLFFHFIYFTCKMIILTGMVVS